MQLTKGAIGNLINRYKAVLKKCHLMNTFGSLAVAGMLIMGGAGMAVAADAITTGQDFQNAVTNAKSGDTITLGQDIKEGVGAVFTGKTVTVDFGGHTYTGYSDSVGSSGTETQLFQLLKDSPAVTLKNGILNIATSPAESGKFKMVLQNYCGLTLDNMVVDGTNLLGDGTYTMSNNHGDITINNSTIIAKKGEVAFDVYYTSSYDDGVSVTVNNSTINGKIEVTVASGLKDDAKKHQLTLTGGTLTGGLTAAQGAQLYNEGTTVISDVAMAGNTATEKGGAIFNSDDKTGAKGNLTLNNVDLKDNKANFGGAIWNEGTLTVNRGSFEGNKADTAAGAIYNAADAELTVDGVTFASNSSAIAGAINNSDGTVTIKNSTFKGNDAGKSMGGAVRNNSGSAPEKSIITITGSTFEGNKAGNGGAVWNGSYGQVDITGSTFKSNTALAENGPGQGGAITNANAMTITGGSFANNTANYSGGAIYNGHHAAPGHTSLTIDGTTFTGNSVKADFSTTHNDNIAGGAIFNDTNAKLDVKNATFTGNTSSLKGGAIFNRDGEVTITDSTFKGNSVPTSAGGAVLNESGDTNKLGTITIKGSTFEGNTAGNGGAVWNGSDGEVTITDSTFKGNTALVGAAQQGGAITNAHKMTITGSTFEGNKAGKLGGAIYNAGALTLNNSTFTGNSATGEHAHGGAIFNAGTITFTGSNTFAGGGANDIFNAGTITVDDGTTTLDSGLSLAADSTTTVKKGGALVVNGITEWKTQGVDDGKNLGSLKVDGGALTLRKDDVLVGYDTTKKDTSLSVTSGSLYLINNSNYTAENFTAAKETLAEKGALNVDNASFGFVGGTLLGADNKATDLVVSGNTIGSATKFTEGTVLAGTEVDNNSFLQNDLKVDTVTDPNVAIEGANVAVNKVKIEASAGAGKTLTITSNGSLTVVGGNANDQLIANGTDDLTTITVNSNSELNLGSAAMPERGAGTLGSAKIALDSNGSLNASNGDYTVDDVTGSTGAVTANTGANLNTGKINVNAVTADAANIKATGDVEANTIDLVKGGSVTSSKNIKVTTSSITNADGTLQAGENITATGKDLTQAAGGKLTVVAGGTIEAAGITATNVAAKKLTASGDVAVDGGTLNLTGTDASTVKNLKLTNGTQADIAGSLQLDTGKTLTVGTGDDTVGGTTLSAQHINLKDGKLLVDPAWGLASSNVAVASLSETASEADVTVNGSVGVGQNSYLALGTADTGWLPGVVGNYTKGVGLSQDGITAALGVFKGIEIDNDKALVVNGGLMDTATGTALTDAVTDPSAANTATFGANSLLVVNGANIYGDKAAIKFAHTGGGKLTVDNTSRLVVTDAVAGQDYTIVDNVTNVTTVQDGTSTAIATGGTVWKTEGLSTTTDMISLGDAVFTQGTGTTTGKVTTSAVRNDAHTVFPNLSDGMANAVNDLYTGRKDSTGKSVDYADVNSADMGVRFLSRATDNRFLGMDKEAAAATIESAARIAFAGAVPQMTKMASDAGTNAVVNRLGFADPADGAQAMDADGKIVDRNTTGFALWIAPLWQSQHGWGMDADSMDYGFNGNLGGVSLGADYTFENAIRAGITFNIGGGYAESSGGDLSSTDNRMNFWGLGAYAGWNYENFGVMADVSYTSTWNQLKQDVDSRMGMGDLEADVQATAISAGLRAEYLLQTSAMDIIPHIGVRYMSLNTWGYDVDTHGGTVLEGDSLHQDIWTFPIGVTFSKDFTLDSGWSFKPSLDFTVIPAAGDIKAKHDVHFTGLPGTYEVETQMMDYLTWQGGVGLELANDNMSIGVNYTLQAGQHTTGHGVFGSFRYEF